MRNRSLCSCPRTRSCPSIITNTTSLISWEKELLDTKAIATDSGENTQVRLKATSSSVRREDTFTAVVWRPLESVPTQWWQWKYRTKTFCSPEHHALSYALLNLPLRLQLAVLIPMFPISCTSVHLSVLAPFKLQWSSLSSVVSTMIQKSNAQ